MSSQNEINVAKLIWRILNPFLAPLEAKGYIDWIKDMIDVKGIKDKVIGIKFNTLDGQNLIGKAIRTPDNEIKVTQLYYSNDALLINGEKLGDLSWNFGTYSEETPPMNLVPKESDNFVDEPIESKKSHGYQNHHPEQRINPQDAKGYKEWIKDMIDVKGIKDKEIQIRFNTLDGQNVFGKAIRTPDNTWKVTKLHYSDDAKPIDKERIGSLSWDFGTYDNDKDDAIKRKTNRDLDNENVNEPDKKPNFHGYRTLVVQHPLEESKEKPKFFDYRTYPVNTNEEGNLSSEAESQGEAVFDIGDWGKNSRPWTEFSESMIDTDGSGRTLTQTGETSKGVSNEDHETEEKIEESSGDKSLYGEEHSGDKSVPSPQVITSDEDGTSKSITEEKATYNNEQGDKGSSKVLLKEKKFREEEEISGNVNPSGSSITDEDDKLMEDRSKNRKEIRKQNSDEKVKNSSREESISMDEEKKSRSSEGQTDNEERIKNPVEGESSDKDIFSGDGDQSEDDQAYEEENRSGHLASEPSSGVGKDKSTKVSGKETIDYKNAIDSEDSSGKKETSSEEGWEQSGGTYKKYEEEGNEPKEMSKDVHTQEKEATFYKSQPANIDENSEEQPRYSSYSGEQSGDSDWFIDSSEQTSPSKSSVEEVKSSSRDTDNGNAEESTADEANKSSEEGNKNSGNLDSTEKPTKSQNRTSTKDSSNHKDESGDSDWFIDSSEQALSSKSSIEEVKSSSRDTDNDNTEGSTVDESSEEGNKNSGNLYSTEKPTKSQSGTGVKTDIKESSNHKDESGDSDWFIDSSEQALPSKSSIEEVKSSSRDPDYYNTEEFTIDEFNQSSEEGNKNSGNLDSTEKPTKSQSGTGVKTDTGESGNHKDESGDSDWFIDSYEQALPSKSSVEEAKSSSRDTDNNNKEESTVDEFNESSEEGNKNSGNLNSTEKPQRSQSGTGVKTDTEASGNHKDETEDSDWFIDGSEQALPSKSSIEKVKSHSRDTDNDNTKGSPVDESNDKDQTSEKSSWDENESISSLREKGADEKEDSESTKDQGKLKEESNKEDEVGNSSSKQTKIKTKKEKKDDTTASTSNDDGKGFGDDEESISSSGDEESNESKEDQKKTKEESNEPDEGESNETSSKKQDKDSEEAGDSKNKKTSKSLESSKSKEEEEKVKEADKGYRDLKNHTKQSEEHEANAYGGIGTQEEISENKKETKEVDDTKVDKNKKPINGNQAKDNSAEGEIEGTIEHPDENFSLHETVTYVKEKKKTHSTFKEDGLENYGNLNSYEILIKAVRHSRTQNLAVTFNIILFFSV